MRSLKDIREEKKRISRLIDDTALDIKAREDRMRVFYCDYRRLDAEETEVAQELATKTVELL